VKSDSRLPRGRCVPQRQRISLLVDGELPLAGRLLVRVHLLRCEACRAFRTELTGLAAALRSTALARPAASSAFAWRFHVLPQRLALAGGLAVLGLAVTMSGVLRGTAVGKVGALSPVQGLPVYSTPYQLEGLPVYTQPSALVQSTLAS
jgi:predicted anti-sigma-YlaC factor YlaD